VRVLVQTPELDVVAQAVATIRTKEANKAREKDERSKWSAMMCAAIAAKKATGLDNDVRRSAMRRPRPTWPRGRKSNKVYSWPMVSYSIPCQWSPHQLHHLVALSTWWSRRSTPISTRWRMATTATGCLTRAPPTT
jgi:hypothetical protein